MKTKYIHLIEFVKNKDENAFYELYEMFYSNVYNYAYKLTNGNKSDTEEIVQEVFVSVWNHIHTLKSVEYFPLWLKRITHNKCIKLFEKNRTISLDIETITALAIEEQTIDFLPRLKSDDEGEKQIIYQALSKLSSQQKEILYLFYIQQLSLKEIQSILKINEGTAKSRLYYARKSFKNLLEEIETKEDRKIYFHLECFSTSVILVIFTKLKQLYQKRQKEILNAIQVGSMVACVGVAVLIQNEIVGLNASEEVLRKDSSEESYFQPIEYQGKLLTTPSQVYYVIQSNVTDSYDYQKMPEQKKQALNVLFHHLKIYDSKYAETLQKLGY